VAKQDLTPDFLQDLTPDFLENHWRLEPNPPVSAFQYYTGQRRNGFKLHPGTLSMGCITVDPSDEDLMNSYNELDYLLRRDLQRGRGNYLYVAP
jgi:hypothetical protein